MPSNYPNGANGGRDTFNEPSSPEFTPLSSAGQYGTRNHVEHTALARPVRAEQAQSLPGRDFQADILDKKKMGMNKD